MFKVAYNYILTLSAITMLAHTTPALSDRYDNEWENVPGNNKNNSDNSLDVEKRNLQREQSQEADQMEEQSEATSKQVRRFHEVLDELLAEFGYDVRMGQLNGLKNVSIRRVEVSDALPNSYRSYIEMLVAERIRENSRVRLISCLPCRGKTSHLVEGRLMITSPSTNVASMHQAAEQLGIDNFMDIVLVYHTTHMVLALQVFNASTQETVWTRTYNSETIKSRYQKLAVDYRQVEQARPGEDYNPEYRFLLGLGGGAIPNITNESDDNGMIALAFRGAERFDNRKHEFGLHLSIYARKNALLGQSESSTDESSSADSTAEPTVTDLTPWDYGLALYGMYGRVFVGSLESYNDIRHGINAGIGFLASASFVTASLRFGWDIYFGRRFSSNFGIVALASSTANTPDGDTVRTKGGVGGDFTISLNF